MRGRIGRGRIGIAAAAALGLVLALVPASTASGLILFPDEPNKRCGWPINYPDTANYAFPDTNAAYFVQAALVGPDDEIVITGKDPRARYWSLQTYRFSDSTLIDSVNDVTVKRTGSGKKKRWTIRVVAPTQDTGRDPNVLSGAGDFDGAFGSNITVVMYRVYVPATKNASGGPMPKVALRYLKDGRKVTERLKPCSKKVVGPPTNRPKLDPAEGVTAEFVRGAAARFYPSADTAYLVAQAPYLPDNILVMTGKAPRVRQDVRYWSVCQNVNEGDLPVVDCLRDDEITLGADRRYTIAVVGPGQITEEQRAQYPGVTFLEWVDEAGEPIRDAFLIYRNILSNPRFAGSAANVPIGELAEPVIGDFAPRLTSYPRGEFESLFRVSDG